MEWKALGVFEAWDSRHGWWEAWTKQAGFVGLGGSWDFILRTAGPSERFQRMKDLVNHLLNFAKNSITFFVLQTSQLCIHVKRKLDT